MATGKRKAEQDLGVAAGAAGSARIYADNVVFHARHGHGFAAEKANHLADRLGMNDAQLVGGDNAKNGADRVVAGVQIQTKYCATGRACVSQCFDDAGQFRYVNLDGSPMQIEVPSDKYAEAVDAMADKIRAGKVRGVNDPLRASDIIRQGSYTYEQARRIALPGTIEGLRFDAANGIELAGTAAGISAVMTFALAVWNGASVDKAVDEACYTGLKVGGVAWVTSLVTAQVGRTGVEQGLRSGTDWMVQQLGGKTAGWVATALRSGNSLSGAAAQNHLSKLLRGNMVAAAVATLVLSTADVFRMFEGQVSGAQVFKNVASTAAGVAGGMGGMEAGGALGFALGGPVGSVVGTVLGGIFGGAAASEASKMVLDGFIEDDAVQMAAILEKVFAEEVQAHLINARGVNAIIAGLKAFNLPQRLREMYAASDREQYARKILRPLFDVVLGWRKPVAPPTDAALLAGVARLVEQAS
jgi:hypothetical protein